MWFKKNDFLCEPLIRPFEFNVEIVSEARYKGHGVYTSWRKITERLAKSIQVYMGFLGIFRCLNFVMSNKQYLNILLY